VCEENLERLRPKIFKALFRQGYLGVSSLIDIANSEDQYMSSFVLEELSKTRTIQRLILVPSMIVSLNTKETMKKLEVLAGLN